MNNIEKYDLVEYIDVASKKIDKNFKTIHVAKCGLWDGEKVMFNDGEKTTVRKKEWLKIIEKNFHWTCKFKEDNTNVLIFASLENKKTWFPLVIPPGQYRTDIVSLEQLSPYPFNHYNGGYLFNFGGFVIVSEATTRKVFYKGRVIAEVEWFV